MRYILILGLVAGQTYKKKTVVDFSDLTIEGGLISPEGSFLQARPGGAQDADYFRSRALAGEIPQPEAITPEGLLAGHQLPLADPPACAVLLCPAAEAARASLVSRPEVTHLVQLGFVSGIAALRRAPSNLILLVDRSGSMEGEKLSLVKETLRAIAGQMRGTDQLGLVTFADAAEVQLQPTRDRGEVLRAIERISSSGSTAIEAGLDAAFALGRSTRGFDGTTRVMLFTDEQPNVGRTDAAGFRAQAEAAAKVGIGLTIIGVGVDFGVELATEVSSVRGGSLFYFADPIAMKKRITEELDLMTTELGHDLELEIAPRAGMRIAGVYGVPDRILRREGESIAIGIRSLFATRRKSAIYLALAPNELDREEENGPLVALSMTFVEAGGTRRAHRLAVEASGETLGLRRGEALIDAYVGLHTAAERVHHLSDRRGALEAIAPVAARLRTDVDPDLAEERRLVLTVEQTLGGALPPRENSMAAHTIDR